MSVHSPWSTRYCHHTGGSKCCVYTYAYTYAYTYVYTYGMDNQRKPCFALKDRYWLMRCFTQHTQCKIAERAFLASCKQKIVMTHIFAPFSKLGLGRVHYHNGSPVSDSSCLQSLAVKVYVLELNLLCQGIYKSSVRTSKPETHPSKSYIRQSPGEVAEQPY